MNDSGSSRADSSVVASPAPLAAGPLLLPRSRRRLALVLGLAGLLHGALVLLGLRLGIGPFHVSPIWPAAGFALAAVYALGYRVLPVLFVVHLAVAWLVGNPLAVAAAQAVAALTGPALGTALLRRFVPLGSAVTDARAMWRFLLVAAGAVPVTSALAGVAALAWLGRPGPADPLATFALWWAGNTVGTLTVAPFLHVWLSPGLRRPFLERPWPGAALLGVVAGVTLLALGQDGVPYLPYLHPEYVVLPFLVWVTIRLGLFGAANGNMVLAGAATAAGFAGAGPFGHPAGLDLAGLEALIIVTAGTTLMLGVVVLRKERGLSDADDSAELRRTLSEFQGLVEQPQVGMMVLDREGAIQFTNSAAASLMDRTPEELIGASLGVPVIDTGRTEIGIQRANGEPGEAEIAVSPVRWGGESFYLVTFHDVTERNQAEREVRHQARHDDLTGLASREHFKAQVEAFIRRNSGQNSHFALLFLDLDRFKEINDTLGHSAGDQLLRVVAERLRASIRDADLAARMSGDEFVVFLEGVTDRDTTYRVADKLRGELFLPVRLGSLTVTPTATMGVSLFPQDGRDFETLFRQADIAMYAGKEAGRDRVHAYEPEQGAQTSRRFQLEQALRRALENREFRLYYQPQLTIDGSRLVGVEALLRWESPEEGMVSPGDFIPLLEETGLIVEVGEWIFRQAARDLLAWDAAGLAVPRVWVNVAARQLEGSDLPERLDRLVPEMGIAPARLGLELTETGLTGSLEHTTALLEGLRDRGFALAMDDFGTGFSALSFLRSLPLDLVKIDQSFVLGLWERGSQKDCQMVRSIIGMAHGLEMKALAEGVEDEADWQLLRQEGCDFVQGFLFARPVPADRLAENLPSGDDA